MIRKEYDDIIWVSASLKGSQIHIDVKENSDPEKSVKKIQWRRETISLRKRMVSSRRL
mgnify:FL=1